MGWRKLVLGPLLRVNGPSATAFPSLATLLICGRHPHIRTCSFEQSCPNISLKHTHLRIRTLCGRLYWHNTFIADHWGQVGSRSAYISDGNVAMPVVSACQAEKGEEHEVELHGLADTGQSGSDCPSGQMSRVRRQAATDKLSHV